MLSFPDARPIPADKEVMLECMMGGKWNVDRIPKCSRELTLTGLLYNMAKFLAVSGHMCNL